MSFTIKFFHPPQRSVPCHNGMLNTRTKHIIAQDRLVVAEQRILEAERLKSASNLQSLAFEQKQMEKRLILLHSQLNASAIDRAVKLRARSTSDIYRPRTRRSSSWNETSHRQHSSKYPFSLHNSNQQLLTLPRLHDVDRRFSAYSDGDLCDEQSFFTSGSIEGSDDDGENQAEPLRDQLQFPSMTRTKILPPIVSVIPPDEDALYLIQ